MKTYLIKFKDRSYCVKALDSYLAAKKLKKYLDERLSPMTYKKLKELGYDSDKWKNLSQEQANKIVNSNKKSNNSEKESNSTVTKENKNKYNINDNTFIKAKKDPEVKKMLNNMKAKRYYSVDELKNSNILKFMDKGIEEYEKNHTYTTDENQLQNITKQLLDRGSFNNGEFNGELKKNKKAVIDLGLPASGKSSMLAEPQSKELGAYIIDSDEAKFLFKEFKESNGLAANQIHHDSKRIMKTVKDKLFADGTNVVIPIIGGDRDKIIKDWIEPLQKAGYDIQMKYKDADSKDSLNRVIKRAYENGRPIPSDVILGYGDKPKKVFESFKNDLVNGKKLVRG